MVHGQRVRFEFSFSDIISVVIIDTAGAVAPVLLARLLGHDTEPACSRGTESGAPWPPWDGERGALAVVGRRAGLAVGVMMRTSGQFVACLQAKAGGGIQPPLPTSSSD